MELSEDQYLSHYGVLRRSGRYKYGSGKEGAAPFPWSSGRTQAQRNKTFLDTINDLKSQGLTDTEIVKGLGLKSTTQLRSLRSIAGSEHKQAEIIQAQMLKDKGYSNVAIGKKMGKNESSVRALLAPGAADKSSKLNATSDMLKRELETKKFIDIGAGVEFHNGVSTSMLNNAVGVLKEQGYEVHTVPVRQLGTNKDTNVKVLAPPGTTWGDVRRGQDSIEQMSSISKDHGRSYSNLGVLSPMAIDEKRVAVNYKEDGGHHADGVLYIRPGVKDVSIGNSAYAQVRVQVGNGHYIKGMAMYKDDLPKGVDIVFNTNKSKHDVESKLDALKPLKRTIDGKVDKDNPFGANIKRQLTEGPPGKEKLTSAMNIVNEEGAWSQWSRTLSSQMLSKQSPTLAREQLDRTFKQRKQEFEKISALTNPSVRKKLLLDFGDDTDSAAVQLNAAAIPRTHGHHVILPIQSMKPNEVFAPNYRDGETVVLIRHPHGGPFEIPSLTVNNKQREARKIIGKDAKDAIGIHHSVAERLSGADFDGDTVLVIPNGSGKVKTTKALDDLKDFDPKSLYKKYPGMVPMTKQNTQAEMGKITNLINDMSIHRASSSEMARAIKHSMVVIDAEKHELNYKQSALDNGIKQLKTKYQGKSTAGASTLISRAGAKDFVNEFKPRPASQGGDIDKATGKRVFVPTNRSYVNPKTGETVFNQVRAKRLSLTDDARTLMSGPTNEGTPIERLYADHSNRLKGLANASRKEGVNTKALKYSPSARKVYKDEVKSLDAQLELAKRNAPLERQAQILANTTYRQKQNDHPEMDDETKKKVKYQALTEARNRTGAGKTKIKITDKEWEAIQAGAVSPNKLDAILTNADMEIVRKHATPHAPRLMSTARVARAKTLLDKGYTRAEIADLLGVSLSTLDEATTE